MNKKYWIPIVAVLVLGFAVWWPFGGQHWLAIHTGTLNEPGPYYGFWSGFGSDLGEYVIVGSITSSAIMAIRHMNCHVKGCPRVGRFQLAGGEYKVCGRHHQAFDGDHPSLEHMWHAHRKYQEGIGARNG